MPGARRPRRFRVKRGAADCIAASWLENAGRILARSAQRVKAIICGVITSLVDN
jgi:hypothetical protein